ncbi:MAG: NAD(P)H-dependent glycerol-3-phosphate dehydrogenase [Nitriliruptorales bacterium]|nr:NAD(P)H-dependent glycerol-3-phosphate dehydrogenase [Nitriliruptorales bacterium]
MGRVAVMGAGSWGTAFSVLCADAGEDVVLWARRDEVAEEVNRDHRNSGYLGDAELPMGLRATGDPAEALEGAEVVVLAIPSHALRLTLRDWSEFYPRSATSVSLIKGIEPHTRKRASEVIRHVLDVPDQGVVVVSGPNLAMECARRLPSATVAAGTGPEATRRVQAMCHTPYFRVYTNPDLVGVELGGAIKNAIALAAGMAHGMGFGDNTKAMLVTRGLAEMTRLGLAHGGNPLTFAGLAGMGDLVATCMSSQSRNRHVGEQIGRGRRLEDIISEMNMVAEGVKSSRALLEMAKERDVEMPIVEHVVKVVHLGQDPKEMVHALMTREPKPEFHGLDRPAPGALSGGLA